MHSKQMFAAFFKTVKYSNLFTPMNKKAIAMAKNTYCVTFFFFILFHFFWNELFAKFFETFVALSADDR